MKVLSLSQFIQQQGVEPPDSESQETMVVTVRSFLDAVQNVYEDDWTAEVTCDYPEPGSFLVKFVPAEEPEP